MLFHTVHILALNDSSGIDDFLSQVSGLLIITCIAGLIWIGLMMVVAQRAAERRRRAQLGLAPLPGVYVSVMNWLTGSRTPPAPVAAAPVEPRRVAPVEPIPAPDLGMLTGDLSEIDEAALFERFSDEPLNVETPIVETQSRVTAPKPQATEYIVRPLKLQADMMPEPTKAIPIPSADNLPLGVQPRDSVEVLRVWRDLSDGMLIVEIDGKQFRSLNDLRSAELERRFLNVVRDLNALSTPGYRADPPPAAIDPAPQNAPAAPPPAAKEAGADAMPPSLSPGSMFRQMRRVAMGQKPEPVEIKPTLSIAEQIEELLQARLAELPAHLDRAIHVRPSLHGGVQIEVDGRYYEGIGEVEDDEVRNLLIDIVREWEQSQ
jgi:hypothetical protein